MVARGVEPAVARAVAAQWVNNILLPDATIEFDDPEIGVVPGGTILANCDRYDGETCADPIEGISYGRNKAIFSFRDSVPIIFSLAHGDGLSCHGRYELRHDAASVRAAIMAADKTEAARVLVRMMLIADVDTVDKKLLINLVGERTGSGVKPVESMLERAFAAHRAKAAQAVRDKNAANSKTVRLDRPIPDEEVGPIMIEWDGVLSNIDVPEPPMRDIENWPISIQCREAAGMHELTSSGSNAEEDEKPRLPSPRKFLLTKHDKYSAEIEIGDHITFVKETMDGERYVAPPDKFLVHYLK